uniref:Uncharacterized protein n=1 Tax=Ignisphaera aggregans TaxID=334771 RepID=A0A7C5TGU3_9CREN
MSGTGIEEVRKKIDECIEELSRYKFFSPEAWSAIDYLEKLKEQLKNLTKQSAQELIKVIDEMYKKAQVYASFIPKTIENLRFIREWLEKKLSELPS